MTDVPAEMLAHYRTADEGSRITSGYGQLELLRTQEIVRRRLPDGPLKVLDVGGGTGVHAAWLAADGHQVRLFDVVPEHVASAQRLAERISGLTASLGDARNLPVPDAGPAADRDADSAAPVSDAGFDVALMLGPLYHLTERDDRVKALREAGRAVRPGGLIFAAAISRFASLFDGLARGFLFDPEFRRIVDDDLGTGQHRNQHDRPGWFTTAYFHHPDDLHQECVDAGLEAPEIVGVEGMAGWLPHLADRWDDPASRDIILQAARATETEPSLRGLGGHFIAVARVPG